MSTGLLVDAACSAFLASGEDNIDVKPHCEAALRCLDAALLLEPEKKPYLWQRGLVLYYLKRFQEAAAQFEADFEVRQ